MEEQFTTSDGAEVPLRRVSRVYVARIHAKYPIPETPTYTAKIVGGSEQTFQHNATSLETPEDHKMWNEYVEAKDAAVSGRLKEVAEFLLFQCVDLDPPPTDEWRVDFDMFGIEPPDPTNKLKYKIDWIEMELVPDPDDYGRLMGRLYGMAGILEPDMIEEFERFFRLTVGRLAAGG
jgi:hypothetical protein